MRDTPPPPPLHIIHLIPHNGIGGVEVAACEAGSWQENGIRFELMFMLDTAPPSQWAWLSAFWQTWRKLSAASPDAILVSLWRAVWMGWFYKVLKPKVKLVVFLHLSKPMHWIDRLGHWLALRQCHEIWGDCESTIKARLASSHSRAEAKRAISYLTHRFQPLSMRNGKSLRIVYWGRIAAQKNLAMALDIFSRLLNTYPDAHLDVIGPSDAHTLQTLKSQARLLGCAQAITWHGACSAEHIQHIAAQAQFYLQTSLFEGMSMSVVEAMQMGLVAVVTPVGEIASYATHMHNAIVIKTAGQAVIDIAHAFEHPHILHSLSENAIHKWRLKSTYPESMRAASMALRQSLALTEKLDNPANSTQAHRS